MKIIAVDDERRALNSFIKVFHQVEPDMELIPFTESDKAFEYLANNQVDIAFLDIEMDGYTGLQLAEKCKALCPTTNVIFVTGFSRYAIDALKLHVSGYLLKPVRAEELRAELDNLRHPCLQKSSCRMRIQTFGNFEVFVDGKLWPLTATKARECLAYLVDRKGARVTYSEIAGALWEDRPYDRGTQNNTHQAIHTLFNALKAVELEDVLIRSHKEIAIDTEKVDCDYYAAIKGDQEQAKSFTGEYMSQYSWGELTVAKLCELIK